MNRVKAYWQQLQDREKEMLLFGGVCFVFYLFYVLLYSPLNTAITLNTTQLHEAFHTLHWMEKAKQNYTTSQSPKALSHNQLLTVFGEQLQSASFQGYPYQLEQIGSGNIQLSFDRVPYPIFLSWLWKLNQRYAFSIQQLQVEKSEIAGVVKVTVVIGA